MAYGIAPFERLTLAWLSHFTRALLGFTEIKIYRKVKYNDRKGNKDRSYRRVQDQ